jgi:hypothetical protein
LTIHWHPDDACTSSCWLPVVDCGVTELPLAPLSVTAGVAPGEPPAGTTKIWNAGPDAGAGAHWYAQPMFQGAAPTVNGALVHAPRICVGPSSTCTLPVALGAVVEEFEPAGADVGVAAGDEAVGEDVGAAALDDP